MLKILKKKKSQFDERILEKLNDLLRLKQKNFDINVLMSKVNFEIYDVMRFKL